MTHKLPHLIHQKYRPDIDGLRAVAILVVLAFHAFPWRMPGGFIGVDIFFVISGFLISTIIFSSLEKDRFSLLEFYVRRTRRIFPALLLVLIFCLAVGWFFLFDNEYRQLGEHSAAGSGFVQNFILWRESGYFAGSSETKPLLHLWSLAIEEQFYIFWPLLLAFVWKRQWNFLAITLVVATFSFIANVHLTQQDPTSAFYLPFSRFWELMIGGILSYTVLHRPALLGRHKDAQSILGFALIGLTLVFLNKDKDFPGFWALLPTLGAFFIISAGPTAWLNRTLLANRLMVSIGLISYPLYLWHWPLLALPTIEEGKLSALQRIGALILAFFLSWLTYRFVEKPFRFGGNPRTKSLSLAGAMLVTGVFGIIVYQTNGMENAVRSSDGRNEYVAYFDNAYPDMRYFTRTNMLHKWRNDCDFFDLEKDRVGLRTRTPRPAISTDCYTRDPNYPHAVLIWGDSHANMLYPGIRSQMPEDWQVLMGYSSACSPNPDVAGPSKTLFCDQSNWFALQSIRQAKPDVVVVAQKDGHSIDQIKKIIAKLHSLDVKRIVFTGPTPHWQPSLPKLVARKLWNGTPQRTWKGVNKKLIESDRQLQAEFPREPNVSYVSLVDAFCNDQGCLVYLGDDKMHGITSYDYGHLTPVASDYLARKFLVKEIVALDSHQLH